jgi:hypothetical protein
VSHSGALYTATCSNAHDNAGNASASVSISYTVLAVPTFTAVGSATRSSAGNASLVATLNHGVAADSTLAVSIATGTFQGAVGCSDSRGNAYTVVADRNTGNGRLFICEAAVHSALHSGDTVTASYPGFSGLSVASAVAITGLDSPGSVTGATTAAGSNPPVNSGSVTASTVPAVIFGAVAHTSVSTFNPSGQLTVVGEVSAGSGSAEKTVSPVFEVVSASGSYAVTGALSGSGFWQAAVTASPATGG